MSEHGAKKIAAKFKEQFTPHLEVSFPRVFETVVYGTPKQPKESFGKCAKKIWRAFTNLAREGVDLPGTFVATSFTGRPP